jgi:hypothetical protein
MRLNGAISEKTVCHLHTRRRENLIYYKVHVLWNNSKEVRVQVLKAASMNMKAFWDTSIAPCSLVEVDRHFRGAYCLHRRSIPESCHPRHQQT